MDFRIKILVYCAKEISYGHVEFLRCIIILTVKNFFPGEFP